MPTYDYTCSACKKTVEIFHSMTEKPRTKCPSCGKNTLQRQLGTGGAIIFKGGGFYQTDYRSDSYKKAAAADSSAAPASSGGRKESIDSKPTATETKAGSKPDSKPETKSKSESKSESKPESKPSSASNTKPAKKPSKSAKD